MLSQEHSKCLNRVGFVLLTLLLVCSVFLKQSKEFISFALDSIFIIYFLATLLFGVKEKKKHVIVVSVIAILIYILTSLI